MGIKEWFFGQKKDDARKNLDFNKPLRYQFSKGVVYGPFELYCGDSNLGTPDEIFYNLSDPYNLLSLSGTLIFYDKKIRKCEGDWYIHYNYEGARYRNKINLREVEGGLIRFVPQELESEEVSDALSRFK